MTLNRVNIFFAHLSTNLCRDVFSYFYSIFFKFQHRHIFVHSTTSSNFFYKKTHFETFQIPYQLCSGNKTFEFFNFLFFKKKDNLVEIHFGHFYFCPFLKSQGQFCFEVLFLEKNPFLSGFQKCKKKSPYNFVERKTPKTRSVLFCHFSDHFSAKKPPYNLKACFTQNTRLTPTAKLCHFVFTYLSTNLCRDFFLHFFK